MKVIELESFGTMVPKDRPEPKPGPGQVVVRIHAVSLNCRDLLMVKGGYSSVVKPPFIPVSDGAGEIAEISAGASRNNFKRMLAAIGVARLKPPVDRMFHFGQVEEAMAYMKAGRHFGKVCISIP